MIKNNLLLRILSSVVLAPIVLFLIVQGGLYLKALLILIILLSFYEILKIAKKSTKWKFILFIYITLFAVSIFYISTPIEILFLISLVWATDIGAYFTGRTIGGPKLAPKISPNKTWSGFLGGLMFSFISASIFLNYYSLPINITIINIILLSVFSQLGDLFESWVKRKFKIKDSGNLIPGHGGILDRIDGIIFTSYLLATLKFILV